MPTVQELAEKLIALQPPMVDINPDGQPCPIPERYADFIRQAVARVNSKVATAKTITIIEAGSQTLDASYTRFRNSFNCEASYDPVTFILTVTAITDPTRSAKVILESGIKDDLTNMTTAQQALVMIAAQAEVLAEQIPAMSRLATAVTIGSTIVDHRRTAEQMREAFSLVNDRFESSCQDYNRMIIAWG